MFQNVIVAWLLRRGLELGGITGVLVTVYNNLPPSAQASLGNLFTGHWQDVTLGSLLPIAVALWGYVWSFRSSTTPHVVTPDKTQTPMKQLPPTTRSKVTVGVQEVKDQKAAQPNVLGDILKSIFTKH